MGCAMGETSKKDADFRKQLGQLASFLRMALHELESAKRMGDIEKAKQVFDRVTTLLSESLDKDRPSRQS